jgi:hypothetical protein
MVIGVLIVIASLGGEDGSEGDNSNGEVNNEESTNNQSESSGDKVYTLNQDVTVDDVRIKVTKVTNLGNTISQEYLDDITTTGAFVRVDYEIENISSEAQYGNGLKIVDSQDRTFDESDEKYSILGDNAEFLDNLNPNVVGNYSTVFDLPTGAKDLKLKVTPFDLFSTDYALIDLGIDL